MKNHISAKNINQNSKYLFYKIFILLLLINFPANNLLSDEISSTRPVGKPLLRYNNFVEKRTAPPSDTNRNLRIEAIKQLDNMVIYRKNYYDELQSQIPEWKNIGPFDIGGRVRSIAVHPNNPNIVYIGAAAGGIWKSTNGGVS